MLVDTIEAEVNNTISPIDYEGSMFAVNNADNIGLIGKALFGVLRLKVGDDETIIACTGISQTQLNALKIGNGYLLDIELFQHICDSLFFQFMYSIEQNGQFRARLRTPSNVYRLTY